MVDTKFWDDNYSSNLDPIEKLLFLYFLTNTSTNISGVYEIPIKKIAVETGIDKEMVLKILDRFSKDGKVFYYNGWLCLKNFVKNQNQNSPKVQAGIKNEIGLIPRDILEKFIGYGYPIAFNIIKSNLILTKDKKEKKETPNRSEALEFNQKLFKGLQDNKIEIIASPQERMIYPRNMRRKNANVDYWIAVAKFSQSYGFKDHKTHQWTQPWVGAIKLTKLYYDVQRKFEDENKAKTNLSKIQEMKKKVTFKMPEANS